MGTDNGDAITGEEKRTQRQLGKKKGPNAVVVRRAKGQVD